MFGFIKNKFAFILGLSILTLILLIVGAVTLYKDTNSTFDGDGYIISTTTKKSAKHYFSANTKYKDNADDKVVFKNDKSKTVSVDPASFVHYNNGSIAFLQKGALVNLNEINAPIVSYYNVTRDNIIKKENSKYILTSNGNDISVDSFIGRISDNKYIVAGNNLSVEIPTSDSKISGDYFEITYIKDGIVKIDNKTVSFQVTAQNSFVNVGNNIRINLGNEKIYYDESAKLLLSQITINGDENINLDIKKKNGSEGEGDGSEDSNTDNAGNIMGDDTETTNATTGSEGTTSGTGDGTSTTSDTKNDSANGSGNGNGNGGKKNSNNPDNVKIELINANVNSIGIDALFQLNNASLIKGKLVATLTNISNNEEEEPIVIKPANGSFKVTKMALLPNTEYNLTIAESESDDPKQFFQKTFKTKDLGVSLERQYVTDSSLSYNVLFDENSDVSKVRAVIYDSSGINDDIETKEFSISKSDTSSLIEFTNLYSNTSYSVSIDTVWIDNIAYKDLYTISRIDTTLKKTPVLSDVQVKANSEEVKFNIEVKNIEDPDESIISYTYKVYKSDSINISGVEPEVVYSLTKDDAEAINLDLSKIEALKTGVNYRCKVFAEYNDNEMIREIESDYSGNFLIKNRPSITWKSTLTTADEIKGNITLVDAGCSIPVSGRTCLNQSNHFILKYYKVTEGELTAKEVSVNFNAGTLVADVDITKDLSSSTAYAFKLYGNYYDDDNNLYPNVQIGDVFYVTTDESTKVKFKKNRNNESGGDEVVTFDAQLLKPTDSDADEDTASITLKLYSGSYNVEEKLIGTYTITDRESIDRFYNNFTITNALFENETLGKLDSLQKMIEATANQAHTLNRSYTVEVAEIMSQNGSTDSIEVEDKLITFNLTPSYYLDSRIASTPNERYVTVTTIAKEDLSEEEYASLSSKISNLDDLSDETVVGITIENSLFDDYVDSAFKVGSDVYEKVVVDYVVYNVALNKEVKRISVNMDNKYRPGSQTIYLDSTGVEETDLFVRGYDYKIGYEIKFSMTEGARITYTNNKLYERKIIAREYPAVRQYISSSDQNSVTYRYAIRDVDFALNDKKVYYQIEGDSQYRSVNGDLVMDNNFHNFTIPFANRGKYVVYLNTKGTDGNAKFLELSSQKFDSVYEYDDENAYTLINDNDNTLKIKFADNDVTNRAVAYKVKIKDKDDNSVEDFNKIFLASKLEEEEVGTGQFNEQGEEIKKSIKYLAIDYAYISRFLKHNLEVSVEAIYDSGLMGINQEFTDGFILEKYSIVNSVASYKYLNVYNGSSAGQTTDAEETTNNSVLKLKNNYQLDGNQISVYNYVVDAKNYNKYTGAFYYLNAPDSNSEIVTYNLAMNKNIYLNNALQSGGIVYGNKYTGFTPKVLRAVNINTSNKNYKFNDIIPRVNVTSNSTINSLRINIASSGVYGQFIKDNAVHNKYYIDVYSDSDLEHKLTTLTSNLTVNENNITAEVVEYNNLKPNTTYYVTVSAYIDNKLTRLYDKNTAGYVAKVYNLKTLDAKGILSKVKFKVKSVGYSGVTSSKKLSWALGLVNKENYKLRFELFDSQDNAVKFNGSQANGCSLTSFGSSTNGYVSGCYIQVSKEDVQNIHFVNGSDNVANEYTFSGDDFVFGNGYYKLRIYAVPYTNNQYLEADKLLIYENASLKTEKKTLASGIEHDIEILALEKPTFSLEDVIAGIRCVTQKDSDGNALRDDTTGDVICSNENEDEIYIEFSVDVKDDDKVIRSGGYTINLRNVNDDILYTKYASVSEINKVFTFTNLVKDSTYNVEIVYDIYRNNNDNKPKLETLNQDNYISTPIDRGVTPGNITAVQDGDSKIILNFDRYNMIEKISRVKWQVKLNSSSSHRTEGEMTIGAGEEHSFVVTDSRARQLTLDFTEDENFRLAKGNSYLIVTQYYYKIGGVEYQINEGNSMQIRSFTTSLNL